MGEWSLTSLPYTAYWHEAVWGNGKFVALGASNDTSGAYSSDGQSWNVITGIDALGGYITFGANKFVTTHGRLSASSGKRINYSTDGITWHNDTNYPDDGFYQIAYGSGKFISMCYDGALVSSTDGINWSYAANSEFAFNNYNALKYVGNKFIALRKTGYSSKYSPDGVSWYDFNMPYAGRWNDVAFGNNTYVAVQPGNNESDPSYAAYSPDGINWVGVKLPISGYVRTVDFGDGKFVCLSNRGEVASSEDGASWSKTDSLPRYKENTTQAINWSRIVYGNEKFVALSQGTNNSSIGAYISSDLISSSPNLWIGVDGKARRASELYVGVGGKARKVTAAYIGVNGKARRFL